MMTIRAGATAPAKAGTNAGPPRKRSGRHSTGVLRDTGSSPGALFRLKGTAPLGEAVHRLTDPSRGVIAAGRRRRRGAEEAASVTATARRYVTLDLEPAALPDQRKKVVADRERAVFASLDALQ